MLDQIMLYIYNTLFHTKRENHTHFLIHQEKQSIFYYYNTTSKFLHLYYLVFFKLNTKCVLKKKESFLANENLSSDTKKNFLSVVIE